MLAGVLRAAVLFSLQRYLFLYNFSLEMNCMYTSDKFSYTLHIFSNKTHFLYSKKVY